MKRLSILLATAVTSVAFVTPAHSAIVSGVLPGVLSPSDTPSTCDTNVSQPFARWGDLSYYVLVPGGSFEPGAPSWKLSGGAKIVSGNETFYVHSLEDRYALSMPKGSTVTTPPMCFETGDWKLRFFAKGGGSLRVKIVVKSLFGVLSVLDGGTVKTGATWQPSPAVNLLLTNVTGLVATDSISLRLTSGTAAVRIDDVYLDPWKST